MSKREEIKTEGHSIQDVSGIICETRHNLTEEQLREKFEDKTGNSATWRGKLTQQYKDWKEITSQGGYRCEFLDSETNKIWEAFPVRLDYTDNDKDLAIRQIRNIEGLGTKLGIISAEPMVCQIKYFKEGLPEVSCTPFTEEDKLKSHEQLVKESRKRAAKEKEEAERHIRETEEMKKRAPRRGLWDLWVWAQKTGNESLQERVEGQIRASMAGEGYWKQKEIEGHQEEINRLNDIKKFLLEKSTEAKSRAVLERIDKKIKEEEDKMRELTFSP